MSDIVKRLRDQGNDAFAKHYSLGMFKLCTEAAEQIEWLQDQLLEAERLLKPLARVANSGDHFGHDDEKSICSWRILGERRYGPTIGECRAAREFVYARAHEPPQAAGLVEASRQPSSALSEDGK